MHVQERAEDLFVLMAAGDGFVLFQQGNQGLVDGFIYVKKNVGSNSIVRMRRGNIVIGGSIGSYSCLS